MQSRQSIPQQRNPFMFTMLGMVILATSQSGTALVYLLEGIQGRLNRNFHTLHAGIDSVLGLVHPHQHEIGLVISGISVLAIIAVIPLYRGLRRKRTKQMIEVYRSRRRLRR